MGNATVESAALAQGLARFFYAANPADTSFPDHKHVPDLFVKVSTKNGKFDHQELILIILELKLREEFIFNFHLY